MCFFLFQIATGWREYTIEKETFKTYCHDKIRMDRLRGTRPDGSLRGRQGSTQGCHADTGTEGQLRGSPGSESSGYPESQANIQGRMCPALG
jgi:hypothetical protein